MEVCKVALIPFLQNHMVRNIFFLLLDNTDYNKNLYNNINK